jgi:hypothetical protein
MYFCVRVNFLDDFSEFYNDFRVIHLLTC